MNKLRIIVTLFRPSVMSASVCIFLAVAIIGRECWGYINHRQLFYEYLFGSHGLKTSLLSSNSTSQLFHDAVFNDMIAYQVLLVVCGAVVWLLVYTLVRGLTGAAKGSSAYLAEMHSKDKGVRSMFIATSRSLAARVIVLVGWGLYVAVFLNILLPLCVMLAQRGVDHTSASAAAVGWAYIVGSTGLLAVCLHLHTVFVRLFFLRLRIFGGLDADIYLSGRS